MLYAYDADCADINTSSKKKDESLTRFLNSGKYQLMHTWDFQSSAHHVCATAAMNQVQSPLIITSTSDK